MARWAATGTADAGGGISHATWVFGQPLSARSERAALAARTHVGTDSDTLKLERRFSPPLVEDFGRRGHAVELMSDFDETMGHAAPRCATRTAHSRAPPIPQRRAAAGF